jgi:hypothetical protein
MGQNSKSYSASFTSDGNAKIFNLAYLPRSVFFLNKTGYGQTAQEDVVKAYGFSSDPNGYAYADYHAAASAALSSRQMTSGGFSFITRDTPQFGAAKSLTAISKAADAQITVANHGYLVGDTVWITNTDLMNNITGFPLRVKSIVDGNNFTVEFNTNTANFTAATSGTVKQLLYPDLYVPFGCVVEAMTAADPAVITTSVAHSFVVGQRVRLEGFANFGMVQAEAKEAYVTAIGTQSVTLDLDSSGYTAFAWPAESVFDSATDLPMILPIGDRNFGFQGPTPISPLGIPGGFSANTGYQVIVGTGDGTRVMHSENDVCEVHFEFPDQLGDSVSV